MPAGAVYRAQRIPGLFAGNFSLILPKKINFNNNVLELNQNENILEFQIINESNYNEKYIFDLISIGQTLTDQYQEFEIDPKETEIIQVPINYIENTQNGFIVSVTPIHFPHLIKTHDIQIISNNEIVGQNDQENIKK